MLDELHREITKAECYGSNEIIILLNPFFKRVFNIDTSAFGYKVIETEEITDYKIVVDYE